MPKISLILFLGMLTGLLYGCSGSNSSNSNNAVQSPSPTTANPPPSPVPAPVAVQPSAPEISGLIPSLTASQALNNVVQGRQDPFAPIPVQPIVKLTKKPVVVVRSSPKNPSSVRVESPSSVTYAPNFPLTSPPSVKPIPPSPPQPNLARAVAVTGVVEVGGVTYAIVQAPNEPTSRYVRAGQYLSNGQVLVKRIDANQRPTPMVVLEEIGIEVRKSVGESPVAAAPTGIVPSPPQTPNAPVQTVPTFPQNNSGS